MIRLRRIIIVALSSLIAGQQSLHGAGQVAQGSSNVRQSEISQQAILFVEDTNNPRGKTYYGLATWHAELTTSTSRKPESETAIVVQVGIPGPRMFAPLILRRNTDQSLAGSHTIKISFKLPQTSPDGGISTVPGVLMKVSQGKLGAPLIGTVEKNKDSSFLIILSPNDEEAQHNLQLLRDREWLDIPIVYHNGRRAILSLEKGRSGAHVFDEAFAAWKN